MDPSSKFLITLYAGYNFKPGSKKPYAMLLWNNSDIKMTMVSDGINPMFNQAFEFDISNFESDVLTVAFYNYDPNEKDVHLGSFIIKISEAIPMHEKKVMFDLMPLEQSEFITGKVSCSIFIEKLHDLLNLSNRINNIMNIPPDSNLYLSTGSVPLKSSFEIERNIHWTADWDQENDVTSIFDGLYSKVEEGENVFNRYLDAHNYEYYFIPGLYSGKLPGSPDPLDRFNKRRDRMLSYGLDLKLIDVPVDGSVELNGAIIASLIAEQYRETNKRCILVGHSKGAVDISAAISISPEIRPIIACYIAIQAPFLGSPVASDLWSQATRSIVKTAIRTIVGCDPVALGDLTQNHRKKFLEQYPYPISEVPCISFVSTLHDEVGNSNLKWMYRYVKKVHGHENDGVVSVPDAVIPGSNVVALVGLDHHNRSGEDKKYNDSVNIFISLLASALETTIENKSKENNPFIDLDVSAYIPNELYPSYNGHFDQSYLLDQATQGTLP
eukprot:TRINITY_DN11688_c0_g1_i1.p1 TRINITY_DN11688_c0_g1~~TRINITY_DN11688_c0_g1_i1.p1  ORF type:complete len:498 (-),score=99.43 TRINITY_DN11688_c0_g1_i1:51-1544(-)